MKRTETKKTLLMIVCTAALLLCGNSAEYREFKWVLSGWEATKERIRQGVTSKEAEEIVDECMDLLVHFRKAEHHPMGDGDEYLELGYAAFPALFKILGVDEKMRDPYYAAVVTEAFWRIDGINPDSDGEKGALEWTRHIVAVHTNPPSYEAGRYLAAKGNTNDIRLLRQHGYNDFAKELEARLASLPPTPDSPQTGRVKPEPASCVKQSSGAEPTEKPSPNRTWLYLAIAVLILGIGGSYVWRKQKSSN